MFLICSRSTKELFQVSIQRNRFDIDLENVMDKMIQIISNITEKYVAGMDNWLSYLHLLIEQ